MPLSENPEVHPLLGEKVACATVSPRWSLLSYKCSRYYLPLWQLHTDFVDFSHEVYHVMKTAVISSHLFLNREGRWGTTNDFATSFLQFSLFPTALTHTHKCADTNTIIIIIIIIINPLTARVIGVPQMILQPVFSIFPCSPLPSGTCRTPGLSIS